MPKGQINKKINSKGEEVTSPISVFDPKKFYEGTIMKNSEGDPFIIEDYKNTNEVQIRFLDEHQYTRLGYLSAIKAGSVKNVYRPLKYGGYIGDGPYGRKNDKEAYMMWTHMRERVASIYARQDYVTYRSTSICDEWQNFQIFAEWYYNEIKDLNPNYNYSLDKDILQWNSEYKIYGPDTCCIIPIELNSSLTNYQYAQSFGELPTGVINELGKYRANPRMRDGKNTIRLDCDRSLFDTPEEAFEVYKIAKKKHLCEKADRYYNDHAISLRARNAIYNIEFEPYSPEQLKRMDQIKSLRYKDQQLVEKDQEIERLKAQLAEKQNNQKE